VATVSARRDLLAGWRAWRAGTEAPAPADAAELAARLARLAEAGAEALAAPDADLDLERAVIAEVRAAEGAGELPVKPEAAHRRHLAGLLRSALMRPQSCANLAAIPSRGANEGA
jgi:hypothetical protein